MLRFDELRRPAMSLIELLVILGIIAVLVALLVPAVQKAREASNRIQCTNNLKQIALAVHSYHGIFGKLPNLANWNSAKAPASSFYGGVSCADGAQGTWLVHCLPYLEQQPLYDNMFFSGTQNADGVDNSNWVGGLFDIFPPYCTYASTVAGTFICPSDFTIPSGQLANSDGLSPTASGLGITDNGYGATSYSGNVMVFDPVSPESMTNAMTDGTSNTVMIAERYLNCGLSEEIHNTWFGGGYNEPAWAFMYNMNGGGASTPGFGWFTAGYAKSGDGIWSVPGGFLTDFSSDPALDAVGSGIPFQTAPTFADCNPFVVQSAHQALQVGMGDGSVRSVGPGTSLATWAHACIPRDGAPLGSDW